MTGERLSGVAQEWFDEPGWGRLSSPDLDGLAFAHYSEIKSQAGFRSLAPGTGVTFRAGAGEQDGCQFLALDIVEIGKEARAEPQSEVAANDGTPGAYSSSLSIAWDDPPKTAR